MAPDLSEIKKWSRQEHERICQNLARRKKEVVEGDTIREKGQEYRINKNDARHIRRLKDAKAKGSQNNRSTNVGWKRRLVVYGNVALFVSIFVVLVVSLGRLTNLNQEFFRALGGSLLLGAALSFWLRPVMEQAVQHGEIWRSLWGAVWRNPLDNPGMLASLGASIAYAIDWWQPFGSKIGPDVVDLANEIIRLVKSLVG